MSSLKHLALALVLGLAVAPFVACQTASNDAAVTSDIVQVAAATPEFSTFAKAVTAADLQTTLNGAGPMTVFAPTNEAFDKLPAGTLDNLMKPENKKKLQDLLLYHVANGQALTCADVAKLATGVMADTKTAKFSAEDKTVKIGDAKIVTPDIKASNGMIQAIDTVLTPPADK